MRKLRPLTLLMPLLLGACSTAPDAERFATHPASTDAFINANQESGDALPAHWWQLYNDNTLNELVEQALNANKDLQVAQANLHKAQGVLRASESERLPSTDLSGGATYGDAQTPGQDAQWNRSAGLSLAWEVDMWDRIDQAIDAAEQDIEVQRAARDAVRVTVAAETTRSYLNACAYGFQQTILEQSLTNSQAQLDIVNAKVNAGTATELERANAESVVATVKSRLPMVKANRQNAQYELSALLGLPPAQAPQAVASCVAPPQLTATLPVGNGTELLKRRPDLRQAEYQIKADIARVGVATAELYPSVTLGASANYLANDTLSGSDRFSYGVGPLISWHFPNIAATRARIAQADAQADASVAQFESQVLTALKEVEQTLTTHHAVQEQNQQLHTAWERSERAYSIAKARYDVGAIAYNELLSNQRAMLDARESYAASIAQSTDAQVNLFKALGGGWETDTQVQ